MPELTYAFQAAVAEAVEQHFTTTKLRNMFAATGFEPVGGGSKIDIARNHLRQLAARADRDLLMGRVVASIMSAPWSGMEPEPEARIVSRERVLEALRAGGFDFVDGKLVGGLPLAAPSLAEAIRRHDMSTVAREFERALANVSSDPAAAITAASATLESVFKTILEDDGVEMPADLSIKPLWKVLRDDLSLAQGPEMTEDIRTILGGLAAIVNGVGDLRTHVGSAHGRGRKSEEPEARHARLAVHAAQSCALFVLETWEAARST